MSRMKQLLGMAVGDVRFVETDASNYAQTMRGFNPPRSRRPAELAGAEFRCSLYQAIRVGELAPAVVLVRVERWQ